MDSLWQEKKKYTRFDPNKHHIANTCGDIYQFIPYERRYENLSKDQLHILIENAKQEHWQALDLSRCGLDTLPDELWKLPDLQMLYLGNDYIYSSSHRSPVSGSENTFSILPKNIELLINLQVLSITKKPVLFESDDTYKLDKLTHLDIFDCGFPDIPKALLVPSLKELGFNCLEDHLSDDLLELKKMRRLYLSKSNIVELPENIGDLHNLQHLILSGTQIKSLPNSLSRLRHLMKISLRDTPLASTLPPEILNQSGKEIVRFVLAQQSTAPKQYFNESKMVIVGQGHVGKSSILNRLVHNTYIKESSTEGIDIAPWHFYQNGQYYRLNIWDFGGQEIYHSTHQFFLTKRSLYLLVWDALAEDEYGRIDYWLKTIQSFANDSPILIVVNKCDNGIGRIRRLDEADYIERFPQIQNIYYVSCKDNVGIDTLRKDIQALAIQLPLMKTSWLSTWMCIRKKLERLSEEKNFISYKEYLDLCKEENISYEEALSLIKYLHDLGIVLYYHDDPLLKNIVILSSEWGTDAVYKVLDEQERQLKGRNGILLNDDLPAIWTDADRYPQDRYPYLLSLMKKFQLAFEIACSTYLVAELLDNKVISLARNFPFGETLSFRYEYDFLPAGVMTRFIVAINRYLETCDGVKQCWKKGAYLKHHTAYALVRLYDNIATRYVEIKVSGANPRDRQELLTIIRTTFDEINGQFSQIQITERIPCICSPECTSLFDYKKLLLAEQKGKSTIECHETFDDVDIRKLLDGVETHMENNFGNTQITNVFAPQFNPQMNQQFNPVNTVSSTSTSESTLSSTITITVEIRDLINGLHGDMNDLKDELGVQNEEMDQQCEKVCNALNKLDSCTTKDEVTKSGAMKKIERFLKECNDPTTETGKIIAGIKYASGIVKELAQKYNKIAKWMALPQLPFVGE